MTAPSADPPENEVMLTGRKAWTYSDRIESITGGDCRISLTIKEEKVETAIVTDRRYVQGSIKQIRET
jgi:hypothetical protein